MGLDILSVASYILSMQSEANKSGNHRPENGWLVEVKTGAILRPATAAEERASLEASESEPHTGAIRTTVDSESRYCYVR